MLTIFGLWEAVAMIAVRSKDCDFVATILKAYCCVNDESLRTSNTQIRVEEHNVLFQGRHIECHLGILVIFIQDRSWTEC